MSTRRADVAARAAFWAQVALAVAAMSAGAVAGGVLGVVPLPEASRRFLWFCLDDLASAPPWVCPAVVAGGAAFVLWAALRAGRTYARIRRDTRRLVGLLDASGVTGDPRLRSAARATGLEARLVVVADETPLACTIGFLTPRVVVSSSLSRTLGDDELRAVLWHEAYHVRHFDPFRLLISRLLATAFSFVPTFGHLAARFELAKEFAADHFAIERTGHKAVLGNALLKVVAGREAFPGFASVLAPRIEALLDPEGVGLLPAAGLGVQRDPFSLAGLLLLVAAVAALIYCAMN